MDTTVRLQELQKGNLLDDVFQGPVERMKNIIEKAEVLVM